MSAAKHDAGYRKDWRSGYVNPLTENYFRTLRRRLKVGFSVAFILPILILLGYFHFQFNTSLKDASKYHLKLIAESQRNTVDLFLQERVINILNLLHETHYPPTHEEMATQLQHLLEMSDAFIDISVIDSNGLQIGYAGPYNFLIGKDYSQEGWFKALMGNGTDYYITDIYMGFRKTPHFTIAAIGRSGKEPFIIRATLDPYKFHMFLKRIGREKGAESFLLNAKGEYQVVDPEKSRLFNQEAYMPPLDYGSGAYETSIDGGNELFAYAWLKMVPWVLVVHQPLKVAYSEMYMARRTIFISTAVIVLILITFILVVTDRLLKKAQATEEDRVELKYQLMHAAKLVTIGELAAGVAHEINNPLAIISSEVGVIKDMLDPRYGMDHSPDVIRRELEHIDEAVRRAKSVTQKLLKHARKDGPRLVETDLNNLLDEVVSGFLEKELAVSNIKVVRDFSPDIPTLMLDREQLYQVFLNLINNAKDAIEGPGTITLSTSVTNGFVRATVADTGKGITADQMPYLFRPFYTTKEEGVGTGLGLSISLSIVEAMGGTIEVQSVPNAGSAFTVVFPLTNAK